MKRDSKGESDLIKDGGASCLSNEALLAETPGAVPSPDIEGRFYSRQSAWRGRLCIIGQGAAVGCGRSTTPLIWCPLMTRAGLVSIHRGVGNKSVIMNSAPPRRRHCVFLSFRQTLVSRNRKLLGWCSGYRREARQGINQSGRESGGRSVRVEDMELFFFPRPANIPASDREEGAGAG